MKDAVVVCPHGSQCSGCDSLGIPLTTQIQSKADRLASLLCAAAAGIELPDIHILSAGDRGLRDRLDFQIQNGALGLFGRGTRDIVDLPSCEMLSPSLLSWLVEFRSCRPFPMKRASVRLRVGPDGSRGLWLDMANTDIKSLLDEERWLRKILEQGVHVEIGQRRKHVTDEGDRLRLRDPLLRTWFRTSWRDEEVKLWGAVGSFTQPSHSTNRLLVAWLRRQIDDLHPETIVELGSGQGNLSFPALSGQARLRACESDRLALEGFSKSLEDLASRGFDLRSRVEILQGDFLRRPTAVLAGADTLLANPPRSGLGRLLEGLDSQPLLRQVIYVSCHPEGLALDVPLLMASGFQARNITLLDQFPQTRHMEVLSVWRKPAISAR